MKTVNKKLFAVSGLAAVAVAVLVGCASTTLEQQIAVKEPNSWDFKVLNASGGVEYIRFYDGPDKLGFFKFEYGQKHPCNQGFQKVVKTTAPGLVSYMRDQDAKSFACQSTGRYIFRTDENGRPYEGWVHLPPKDRVPELTYTVKYWDSNGEKPTFFLVK